MINALANEPHLNIWWLITADWNLVKSKGWIVPELHTVMRLRHQKFMELLRRAKGRQDRWQNLLKAACVPRPDFESRVQGKEHFRFVNFHMNPMGVPKDQLNKQPQRMHQVSRRLVRVGRWSWEGKGEEHDEEEEERNRGEDEDEFQDEEEEEKDGGEDAAMPNAISQLQVCLRTRVRACWGGHKF